MKKELFLLLTAFAVVPAFAGNLNPDDWYADDEEAYIFKDGTLTAHGSATSLL